MAPDSVYSLLRRPLRALIYHYLKTLRVITKSCIHWTSQYCDSALEKQHDTGKPHFRLIIHVNEMEE